MWLPTSPLSSMFEAVPSGAWNVGLGAIYCSRIMFEALLYTGSLYKFKKPSFLASQYIYLCVSHRRGDRYCLKLWSSSLQKYCMLFRRDRRSHQRAQKADRCWMLKTTIFKKKKKHVLKLNLIKTNSIPQPKTDWDEYKSKATIRSCGCLCNSVIYFKSKADITRPLLTQRLLYSTTICSFPFGKHSNPKKWWFLVSWGCQRRSQ